MMWEYEVILIQTNVDVDSQRVILKISLTLTFQKNCFLCFNESSLKMMNNAFYLILRALFVLKIFKFLS